MFLRVTAPAEGFEVFQSFRSQMIVGPMVDIVGPGALAAAFAGGVRGFQFLLAHVAPVRRGEIDLPIPILKVGRRAVRCWPMRLAGIPGILPAPIGAAIRGRLLFYAPTPFAPSFGPVHIQGERSSHEVGGCGVALAIDPRV